MSLVEIGLNGTNQITATNKQLHVKLNNNNKMSKTVIVYYIQFYKNTLECQINQMIRCHRIPEEPLAFP